VPAKSYAATTSSCCNALVDDAEFERLYGPWDPLDPAEAQEFLADFPGPWWVVGGWAVEAFSGVHRTHHDVDVAIFKYDVPALLDLVGDRYDVWSVSSGSLRPINETWPEPPSGAGQVWLREHAQAPWVIDLLTRSGRGCARPCSGCTAPTIHGWPGWTGSPPQRDVTTSAVSHLIGCDRVAMDADAPQSHLDDLAVGTGEATSPAAAELKAIVDTNSYMTLATATADGTPWASPVWFAHEGYAEFVWVSRPNARHSQNIAVRPEVGIVIFDSTVPPLRGRAVYMEATAGVVSPAEIDQAVATFAQECVAQGIPAWTVDDVSGDARHRLYRARATSHFVLDAHDERIRVRLADS
jgi:hypothetical protein